MAGLPVMSLSDLLGYTSIGCWLCAQFPQVLENFQRQSCEGLALPFLANWYLGDLSNLIGCILTNQLPFQKYLASYFVFIDSILVVQYFYYDNEPKQGPKPPHLRRHTRAASYAGQVRSVDRAGSRYRTLSVVAANVAAGAALAAQQDEINHPHPRTRWNRTPRSIRETSGSRSKDPAGSDVDDEALAAMADSFHSEGGQLSGRKRVSWSTERFAPLQRSPVMSRSTLLSSLHMTTTDSPVDIAPSSERGRALQREADQVDERSESTIRRKSRAGSRRGAGMVFLSVFSLFSIGTLTANQRSSPSSPSMTHVGKVLSAVALPYTPSTPSTHPSIPTPEAPIPVYKVYFKNRKKPNNDEPREEYPPPGKVSRERILGRMFAWLCTTLYFTSRLPQIWKNYSRKSVEGLSMYLFVFAFLGNVFYVASILSNNLPPVEAAKYLQESIPYLLGSGGTLMFDITIVSQSFIYRRPSRKREGSRKISQEEVGLLSGEV